MNNKMNNIISRRSIRKFTSDHISEELIKDILEAAMNAPSAVNQQPWHFVVIKDKELQQKISQIHSGFSVVSKAPIVILVCFEEKLATLEKFIVQDCAAATENILIGAKALGLGAVWNGVYPDKGSIDVIRDCLNIPEGITPFSLIPIGYPAEEKQVVSRYNQERIHFNAKW